MSKKKHTNKEEVKKRLEKYIKDNDKPKPDNK